MKPAVYYFLFVLFLFLSSCQKYESQIKGKVTYIALDDSSAYPAYGAVMEKLLIKNDKTEKISAVSVDTNGNYLFEYVTAGKWKIKGTFTSGDTIYEGISDPIQTNGEDVKTIDLILHFKDTIANE